MKNELDKKLVEKYPKIFADRYKSMQETCMCWGFEHNDGWYTLIDNLCEMIQHHLDHNCKESKTHQVIVEQVKEKYGTLSFYYYGGDEYISGLVAMASHLSGCICEICGNPGKLIHGGWSKTRCDKCLQEEEDYIKDRKQLELKLGEK